MTDTTVDLGEARQRKLRRTSELMRSTASLKAGSGVHIQCYVSGEIERDPSHDRLCILVADAATSEISSAFRFSREQWEAFKKSGDDKFAEQDKRRAEIGPRA